MKTNLQNAYHLKDHLGAVFGRSEWTKLKHCTTEATWRKELQKLLRAQIKAIHQSLKFYDKSFMHELNVEVAEHVETLSSRAHDDLENLFSDVIAIQSKLTFLLIGAIPENRRDEKSDLRGSWKLSKYRRTVVLQTPEEEAEWLRSLLKKRLGPQRFDEEREKFLTFSIQEPFEYWYLRTNGIDGKFAL